MNRKLKVGLLVNDFYVPAWAYKMIDDINSSEYAEVELIIKKDNTKEKKGRAFNRLWKQRRILFYHLYVKFEDRFFKPKPNAFQLKDLRPLVDCETLKVKVKETKFSDIFSSNDIDKIKTFDIDVLVRVGFRILRKDILTCAKYGVWSYHHGDNAVNRGGPAGVWEVLENWDETGVVLQILTEDLDGGSLLSKSFSTTDPLSIKRNRNNYYWKAASLLPRKLNELSLLGEETFFNKLEKENNAPQFYDQRLFKTPTNKELLKGIVRNYISSLKRKLFRLFYFNQWILLYKIEKKNKISKSFFRFKRILPPKDRFWADPFVIKKNGKYFIFIEELLYKEGKGKISVFEMNEKGAYEPPEIIIEQDYHLSYPFLFEEDGELYMIPESSENNTIELYQCKEFPYKWELKQVLMDNVKAVDTTIFKHDNKYWLFTNIRKNEGASTFDELFLFYSNDLSSKNWIEHPMNPIISDVKSARPAGNIFQHRGNIYRPAQNCSKHYGYGMQIKRIIEMNEEVYKEDLVQSIYPNWAKDLISTHTINHQGGLTIIDALIRRKR